MKLHSELEYNSFLKTCLWRMGPPGGRMIAADKIAEGRGMFILSKQLLYLRTANSRASFLPATWTHFSCSFWSILLRKKVHALSISFWGFWYKRGFTGISQDWFTSPLFLSSLSTTSLTQLEGSAPIHTATAQILSLLDSSTLPGRGSLLPPYCSSTPSPAMNPALCFHILCPKRDERCSKKTSYSTSRATNEPQFPRGLPLVVGFSDVWCSVNSDLKLPHTQQLDSPVSH